jgi:fructan beta-fructosidase
MKQRLSILLLLCVALSCKQKQVQQPVSHSVVETYYTEPYRPQYHFSPEAHWMNDPNGLVYLDGEYHLFYQYYPDSTVWGPMHWGHAVSRDLLHWQHLPIALYPDSMGYIFSGSAVVDKKNTSGFGTAENPPMVAIFTYHDPVLEKQGSKIFQNEAIAYSLDKGRTWTKFAGNPVIKNPGIRDFRDPKMAWNESAGNWNLIMAVFDRVHIYSSADLKNWKFESEFGKDAGSHGGVWECPDIFPLKVEGSDKIKWVMLVSINPGGPNGGSATQYFTGDFDGHKFTPDDTQTRWLDWGRDNYAGVTFSDIPASDGRRLFLGWMSNWNYATAVPTGVWRSASTLPRELSVLSENNHYIVTTKPVSELGNLRSKTDTASLRQVTVTGEKQIFEDRKSLMQSELLLGLNLDQKTDSVGLILGNDLNEKLIIGYSTAGKQFYIDRRNSGDNSFSKAFAGISTAPYVAGNTLKLHLYIDAASTELFVDDGRLVMTTIVFPKEKFNKLILFSKGGEVVLNKALYYGLNRTWSSSKVE